MIENVRRWLSGDQDFTEGVELAKKIGTSSVIIRMMERSGQTEYNRDKLERILQEFVKKYVGRQPEEDMMDYPQYDFFSLPEDLQRLDARKKELYRLAGQLRERLGRNPPLEQASLLTDQIMKLMIENQQIWEQISYFLQHGVTKKVVTAVIPDLADLSDAELARFKTNNASNLSKWKKKLSVMPEGAAKDQLAARIHTHTQLQQQVIEML